MGSNGKQLWIHQHMRKMYFVLMKTWNALYVISSLFLQVRFYAPMIASFTVSVLLLGLSHQTKLLAQRQEGK